MDRFSRKRGGVGAGAALAAAVALTGCSVMAPLAEEARSGAHDLLQASHLEPLGVNPASPIAADAERAEQTTGPVPSFATVPPKPGDVRAAAAYKTEVVSLVSDKRALNQWDNAHPAGVADADVTEAYAATERKRVADEVPVQPEKSADTDAYVKKGHEAVGQPEPEPKPPHN